MAVPKRRTSSSKRDKRRAHDALTAPNVSLHPDAGVPHLPHRAYKDEDGAWYYKGEVVIPARDRD